MKTARYAIASIAMLAAGCAAIAGFEPLAFDGATTSDAATDAPSDPSSDGSTPGNDASGDSAIVDAGPRGPMGCAKYGKHDFCDEFSTTIDISDAGWTENPVYGGASLTRDQDSLLGVMPNEDGGPSAFAALHLLRPWPPGAAGLRPVVSVHTLMKVEECPWFTRTLRYFGGDFGTSRYYGSVELFTDPQRGRCGIRLANVEKIDGGEYGLGALVTDLSLDVWHDIGVTLTENGTGTIVSFSFDDEIVTNIEFSTKSSPDQIAVALGVDGPALGGRIRFDDFRADWLAK